MVFLKLAMTWKWDSLPAFCVAHLANQAGGDLHYRIDGRVYRAGALPLPQGQIFVQETKP